MVNNTIAYRRFVDDAMFGIKNMKTVILAVTIGACSKVGMEGKDVIFEVTFKKHDITASAFPTSKKFPRHKQQRRMNYIFKSYATHT